MDGQNDETEEEEESVDEQAGQPMSLLSQLLFRLNVPQYVVAHHMVVTRAGVWRGQMYRERRGALHVCLKFKYLSFSTHAHQKKKKKPCVLRYLPPATTVITHWLADFQCVMRDFDVKRQQMCG